MHFCGESDFLARLALVCSARSAVAVEVLYRVVNNTTGLTKTKLVKLGD